MPTQTHIALSGDSSPEGRDDVQAGTWLHDISLTEDKDSMDHQMVLGMDEDGSHTRSSLLPYPLLKLTTAAPSPGEVTLNLIHNLLGVGLLAVPRALSHTGLLAGLGLMVATACANRWSLLQLLSLSNSLLDEESSYIELGKHIFGHEGLIAVQSCLLLLSGGLLAATLMALADVLLCLSWLSSAPRFFHVFLAATFCTPGTLFRPPTVGVTLTGSCMLSIFLLVLTITWDSVFGPDLVLEEGEVSPASTASRGSEGPLSWIVGKPSGLLIGASILTLQFSLQAGALQVLAPLASNELLSDAAVEQGRRPTPENMTMVAYVTAATLLGSMGIAAYLCFGDGVEGDVLLNFQHSSRWSMVFARAGYSAAAVISFSTLMLPCRSAVLGIFALRRRMESVDPQEVQGDRFWKTTSAIIAGAALIAWLVGDLSALLTLLGAWAVMPLAFVFPCSFLIELRRRRENLPVFADVNFMALALLTVSLVVTVGSTIACVAGGSQDVDSAGVTGKRAMTHHLADKVWRNISESPLHDGFGT